MGPESPKRDFFYQPSSLKLLGVISKLKETKEEESLAVDKDLGLNTVNTPYCSQS